MREKNCLCGTLHWLPTFVKTRLCNFLKIATCCDNNGNNDLFFGDYSVEQTQSSFASIHVITGYVIVPIL